MIDREHCRVHSLELRETRDCAVRACAVAAQIDYPSMREYLAAHGRKPRSGMWPGQYRKALAELGFDIVELRGPRYEYRDHYVDGCERYNQRTGRYSWVPAHYRRSRKLVKGSGHDYNAATVKTLQRELPRGTFLVGTDGHVLCMRDGEVHDFTSNKTHRVETVWRVTEGTGQIIRAPLDSYRS